MAFLVAASIPGVYSLMWQLSLWQKLIYASCLKKQGRKTIWSYTLYQNEGARISEDMPILPFFIQMKDKLLVHPLY